MRILYGANLVATNYSRKSDRVGIEIRSLVVHRPGHLGSTLHQK